MRLRGWGGYKRVASDRKFGREGAGGTSLTRKSLLDACHTPPGTPPSERREEGDGRGKKRTFWRRESEQEQKHTVLHKLSIKRAYPWRDDGLNSLSSSNSLPRLPLGYARGGDDWKSDTGVERRGLRATSRDSFSPRLRTSLSSTRCRTEQIKYDFSYTGWVTFRRIASYKEIILGALKYESSSSVYRLESYFRIQGTIRTKKYGTASMLCAPGLA